jgi:hypothetical protein
LQYKGKEPLKLLQSHIIIHLAVWTMLLPQLGWAQHEITTHAIVEPYTSYKSYNTDVRTVSDGEGGIHAVFRSNRNCQQIPNLYLQRISAKGERLPVADAIAICPRPSVQSNHQVVADDKGGLFVCWQEQLVASEHEKVFVHHLNAKGESLWPMQGVEVCRSDSRQIEPTMVLDGLGGVYICWLDDRNRYNYFDIYAQRISAEGQRMWVEGGLAIVTQPHSQRKVKLIPSDFNSVIAVWEDYRMGNEWKLYAQKIIPQGYTQWNEGGILCSLNEKISIYINDVRPDPYGGFMLTYEAYGQYTAQKDIFITRINRLGTMMYERRVTNMMGNQVKSLVVATDEYAFVYWTDYRNGDADIYGQMYKIKYGNPCWGDSGKRICTAPLDQVLDKIVVTASSDEGQVEDYYLVWNDMRLDEQDIYYLKFNKNGFTTQPEQGASLAQSLGAQYDGQLVDNGKGGFWFTWSDHRPDLYPTIRFQQFDDQHQTLYDAGGVDFLYPQQTAVAKIEHPNMVRGKNDDAYIVWDDFRNGQDNIDIYVQRLNGDGTPLWRKDGIPVCGAPGNQIYASLLPVDGGVYVSWLDYRNQEDDLYIQFIDTLGNTHWTINGLALCTAPNTQNNIRLAEVADKKAFAIWTDARHYANRGFDLYQQIISPGGDMTFAKNGQLIVRDNSYQTMATVASADNGEAVGFWMDERGGAFNVYGQRFSQKGKHLWKENGLRLAPAFHNQRFPAVHYSDCDEAFITWTDAQYGDAANKVVVQKLTRYGQKGWFDPKLVIDPTGGHQSMSQMISDSEKGVVVSWLDYDAKHKTVDLKAQRVNDFGIPVWNNGKAIGIGKHLIHFNQFQTHMGTNGNVLFAWNQMRPSGKRQAYFANFNLDNGHCLYKTCASTQSIDQQFPRIVQFNSSRIALLWLGVDKQTSDYVLNCSIYR